jgi:hypothetical protein
LRKMVERREICFRHCRASHFRSSGQVTEPIGGLVGRAGWTTHSLILPVGRTKMTAQPQATLQPLTKLRRIILIKKRSRSPEKTASEEK